jgi:nitrite reductase (NO-forming)
VGYPATGRLPARPAHYRAPESDSGALFKVAAILLGFLVALLGLVTVVMWGSAMDARSDARSAAETVANTQPAHAGQDATAPPAPGLVASPSYANFTPAGAEEIAAKHRAFPAELPAVPAGPIARVKLSINHQVMQIAPGIRYQTWTFGTTAPGPVIHVREGQLVKVTMKNTSPMPHSIDFHSARIAPNVAFKDIGPGKSFSFSFRADDPGVYMYHCGTKPVLAHIANGMYGAIVVEPKEALPQADREYVLVSSEWYLNNPGDKEPAALDMVKANHMTPDWVTWNGYAGQYAAHPLQAKPGETVRFWVVAAGPSLATDFHVVGTILDRAWLNADMTGFQTGVQTASVAPGGGGVFDVKIDDPGLYPFVSHSFASVNMGQVGLLEVGQVDGSMSH